MRLSVVCQQSMYFIASVFAFALSVLLCFSVSEFQIVSKTVYLGSNMISSLTAQSIKHVLKSQFPCISEAIYHTCKYLARYMAISMCLATK